MVEVESRRICCCGANVWVQVVAYFQMIYSITLFFVSLKHVLASGPYGNRLNVEVDEDDYEDTGKFPESQMNWHSFGEVQVGAAISGITFSSILLVGVLKEKPGCLLFWLVITGIQTVIIIIFIIISIITVFLQSAVVALVVILILLLPFGIHLFCLWIVAVHRQELIQNQSPGADVETNEDRNRNCTSMELQSA